MTKYWQENPNHHIDWGERGGLPIEPRTLKGKLDVISLLVDLEGLPLVDIFNRFILVGDITILFGGIGGNMTINATERQKERELPDGSPAYENVVGTADTRNPPDPTIAQIYVDGTGAWYASLVPLGAGYTLGYLSTIDVGVTYYASVVSSVNDVIVRIIAGEIQVN